MDTLGFIHYLYVHEADIQDRDAAEPLIDCALNNPRLEVIYADGAYAGRLEDWVGQWEGKRLEIVRRRDAHRFEVLPKRWIVERTNGWVVKNRRLRVDYEELESSSASLILLGRTRLMSARLH